MEESLSLSEQLTYSTVRIECQLPIAPPNNVSTGTGFFFRFAEQEDGEHIPAIVTNKHVVEGATSAIIHLNLADALGKPLTSQYRSVRVLNLQQSCIYHPDPDTDLCIILIAGIIQQLSSNGDHPFFVGLSKSLVPTPEMLANLTALEDVVMIGYPNGIWDDVNNMPIIRKGITATHPNLDWRGKSEFMIDAACFPGSSGSPVFLCNIGSYPGREGNLNIGTRVALLGILYAGPQYTATGEVQVVDVPTVQRVVAFSSIPNNLGVVIKAHKLSEFEPLLQTLRNSQ